VADVVRFRGDPSRVDHFFISYFLNSPAGRRQIDAMAKGTTRQRCNLSDLKSIKIDLPPIEEQKRIAAILNKADSLLRKRQQAIRLADDFLRAVFLDMFGKRGRNAALGDYVNVLSGFAFKSENYIGNTGARLLRGINVGIGACEWKNTAFYPQELTQELGRYELIDGDVVLAMDRPWISDGLKCAVINKDVAGSLLVQRVARLRAKGIPCAQFVYQCLIDAEFQRHCRVTETTIPHISPTDLATYPIPKASPQELERFSAIAAKATTLVRSGSDSNERIQSLALSLQSALLS
jgi:type I restriction enzyme S subunit